MSEYTDQVRALLEDEAARQAPSDIEIRAHIIPDGRVVAQMTPDDVERYVETFQDVTNRLIEFLEACVVDFARGLSEIEVRR